MPHVSKLLRPPENVRKVSHTSILVLWPNWHNPNNINCTFKVQEDSTNSHLTEDDNQTKLVRDML